MPSRRGMSHMQFQSTLSVRRATHFVSTVCILRMISIHALREESDPAWNCPAHIHESISIHALREESDCESQPQG